MASIHQEADRFEPRLDRALRRAFIRLRKEIKITKLISSLQQGHVGVANVVMDKDSEKAFDACVDILVDIYIKGGKVQAEELRKLRG